MSFPIQQNQTLVCLGDSITESPTGYVSLMAALIAAKYPDRAIKVINAGIGGNKAPDMLARLDRDVLAHNPDWVTINVGINDVWHGLGEGAGVGVEDYARDLDAMVVRAQAGGRTQVVLATPTIIGEGPDEPGNRLLQEYVLAMEGISQRRSTRLAPTHSDFVLTLRAGQAADPSFSMTTDGVHMNPIGDARMALTLLETLDF